MYSIPILMGKFYGFPKSNLTGEMPPEAREFYTISIWPAEDEPSGYDWGLSDEGHPDFWRRGEEGHEVAAYVITDIPIVRC